MADLAQLAYHAYGSVTDFKNYQGLPMPKWEDLTPKIQKAWGAAAERVATEVRSPTGDLKEIEAKVAGLKEAVAGGFVSSFVTVDLIEVVRFMFDQMCNPTVVFQGISKTDTRSLFDAVTDAAKRRNVVFAKEEQSEDRA